MNLERIAAALHELADALVDGQADAGAEKPQKAARKATKKPEPEPAAELTTDDVMKALQAMAKACGGGAAVKALLKDFNAERVSELSESDYADVITVANDRVAKAKGG